MTSLVAQMVKHLPIMWETQVQSLGREDLLEKGMAAHSSIFFSPPLPRPLLASLRSLSRVWYFVFSCQDCTYLQTLFLPDELIC